MIRIIKMKIAIEKNSWYNWLNNYILYFRAQDKKKKKKKEQKMVGGVKYKIMSPFKTKTTENYWKPIRVNYVYGGPKK